MPNADPLPEILDANCLFGRWSRSDLDCSLETVLRLLESAGIAGALLGSLRAALYDPAGGNEETLAACDARKGLMPAAGVSLRATVHPERAVSEAAEQGFRMLRVFREYEGWPVDYAPLAHMLRAAAQYQLPVMIAALAPGDLTALGRILATISATVIVTGVNTSHTPLVAEAVVVARDCPALYLETSRLEGADTLDLISQELGAYRLIFGTGLPFQYPTSGVALLAASNLSAQERAAVAAGNIRRLCRLTPTGEP